MLYANQAKKNTHLVSALEKNVFSSRSSISFPESVSLLEAIVLFKQIGRNTLAIQEKTRENPADKNDVEREINHNRIVVRERLLIDAREQHAREHTHCQSQFIDARPPTHVGGWLLDTHVKSSDLVLGNNLRVWRQACL